MSWILLFFAGLFEIATGWIRWTPDAAWNASSAEIAAAQHGRADLVASILKSVFGSGEQSDDHKPTPIPTQLNEDGTDPAFDRAGFAALKAKFGKAA